MRSSRRSLLKNLGLNLVALGLGSGTGNAGEPPVLGRVLPNGMGEGVPPC